MDTKAWLQLIFTVIMLDNALIGSIYTYLINGRVPNGTFVASAWLSSIQK